MSNRNCRAIHETILKDIIDLYDNAKKIKDEFDTNGNILPKGKGPLAGSSSLAKANSNLTLVFPVICSRGISIEAASMISKAVEKNCVTMLQRLFASWQIADDSVKDLQDYIGKFHTNISSGVASMDDVFELVDRFSESGYTDKSIRSGIEKSILESNAMIRQDLRNLDFYLPTPINENPLTVFSIKEGAASTLFALKKVEKTAKDEKNNQNEWANRKNSADYFKNQVLDTDYKKANELMPTSMVVNFKIKDSKTGGALDYNSAVIGVKAKLYPISSEDVVKHVASKSADKNWITNFFRATTREISFMKDFVLALDKAKIDAMSLSTRKNTSDKMWKVLERRATNSRLKKAMRQNNNSAAITTLCISQEEVEYMRKYNHIDIERISTVLGLFDSYNLMCICIVDESLEVAKFIFDEHEPMWETISFTHLERESSDNTYKRVVNLMTKISK